VIACIHEISDLESKTPKPNKIWGNFFTSTNPEALIPVNASEANEIEKKKLKRMRCFHITLTSYYNIQLFVYQVLIA